MVVVVAAAAASLMTRFKNDQYSFTLIGSELLFFVLVFVPLLLFFKIIRPVCFSLAVVVVAHMVLL